MKTTSRRHFLKTSAAFAVGITGLHRFAGVRRDGYGPLVPDPEGILDLPHRFSYRIISRAGETMTDGFMVPSAPDGMATFPLEGSRMLLVRNHEVNPGSPGEAGPFGVDNHLFSKIDPAFVYDAGVGGAPCLGGTTTIVYDTLEQRVVGQHLSLAGTLRNCAGGPTPWGTWLTCEETTVSAGTVASRDHGYIFEVPPHMQLAEPVPLKAMGRFNHEAVAVEPRSGIVYETEDQHEGLLYRFIPEERANLRKGGRLQALAIKGRPSFDTRNWDVARVAPGQALEVEWIDLEDVDSRHDDLRIRGYEKGAARFARGEGAWYGNDAVYFACTNGGPAKAGQIWRYFPDDDRLELFIEPNDNTLLENCDNITVAPWGDVVMCEDGPADQFLVGVTPEGTLYKLGHNALSGSEFAGATFSPDGTTLFVNIQHDGLTLAITGPWNA